MFPIRRGVWGTSREIDSFASQIELLALFYRVLGGPRERRRRSTCRRSRCAFDRSRKGRLSNNGRSKQAF